MFRFMRGIGDGVTAFAAIFQQHGNILTGKKSYAIFPFRHQFKQHHIMCCPLHFLHTETHGLNRESPVLINFMALYVQVG